MAKGSESGAIALTGCFLVIFILALSFGAACFFGWLTVLCLGMFGVKAPFWGCVLAWFIISSLFGMLRRSAE